MKISEIDKKLTQMNNLHTNLKFTIERETEGSIPFLDMKISNIQGHLSLKWYNKPMDTSLVLNFHLLAPLRYKK